MTTRPNWVRNYTNKGEIMTKKWGGVRVCVHEHANVFKLRGRKNWQGSAWNQKDLCEYKHISFTASTHETKYLNFIFSSTTRFAISVHIILSGGGENYTFWANCVITAQHELWNTETLKDSPFQTWLHTSCMPTSLSWSNAGPNQMLVVEHPLKAVWINLEMQEDFYH